MINRWPSLAAFSSDLGIGYEAAKAMRRRGSIPSAYWLRVVARAADRGFDGIDLVALASAAERAISPEAAE